MLDHHFHIDSDMSLETTIRLMREWWAQGIKFEAHCTDIKKEGTQSMLNTWMMWMETMAEYMGRQGVRVEMTGKGGKVISSRPPTKEEAHAYFTEQYLGVDDKGQRKSWSNKPPKGQVKADMGDKLWCMDRLVDFATERGVKLKIPSDCEYMTLKKEAA